MLFYFSYLLTWKLNEKGKQRKGEGGTRNELTEDRAQCRHDWTVEDSVGQCSALYSQSACLTVACRKVEFNFETVETPNDNIARGVEADDTDEHEDENER